MYINFLSIYLLTAALFFTILLTAFWLDGSTSKRDGLSWMIVLVGALFWGIVLPLAVIERTRRVVKHRMIASRQAVLSR